VLFYNKFCTNFMLKSVRISNCLEMKFSIGFDFTAIVRFILILANFHCMLLLAAALHCIITDMA